MPSRHGPTALIQKGDWCGSELSVTVAERTDDASGMHQDDVAGQKALWVRENLWIFFDLGQLNGDPVPGEPVLFFNRYRLNKRPGITLPGINDFQAVHAVLQERVELWNQQIVETVRQIGVRALVIKPPTPSVGQRL